jgi:hypothetical protein
LHRFLARGLATAFLVTAVSQAATIYNPVVVNSATGFQTGAGNNLATNVWSYWDSTNASLGTIGTGTYASNISLVPAWSYSSPCGGTAALCWAAQDGSNNLLLDNVSGAGVGFSGGVTAPNNALTFFTRNGVTVLRFLVPTTGEYAISAQFMNAAASPGASTDAIAITAVGGASVLTQLLVKPGGTTNTLAPISENLTAGQTVDFMVASSTFDNTTATAFTASITADPEPASLLLSLGGLGLLLLCRRIRA